MGAAQSDYASVEDLEAAEFDFGEETVEIPHRGGTLVLRLRELSVGRQGKLLSGLLDKKGRVLDLTEMQVRQFCAYVVEPRIRPEAARKFIAKWPSTSLDPVLEAIKRLGGEDGEEASDREEEFPDSDE